MTRTVDLSTAKAQLAELIAALGPDDELVVTKDDRPIARLTRAQHGVPVRGRCKGLLNVVSEDDEHVEDFKEYMP